MIDPGLPDHILFALLAIVLPVLAILRVRPQVGFIPSDTRLKIRLYLLNSGVLWLGAIVVMLTWWLSGHDFRLMGWRWISPDMFPEWVIATMLIILIYMFDTFVSWTEIEHHPASALLPVNWKEFAHFGLVVSVSAGVCEEIVFRGFLLTYMLALFASISFGPALAIILSSIVFALLHAYQGWLATIKIAVIASLFGMVFYLSESLIPVIIIHFLVDFVGGLVALYASRRQPV